MQEEIDQLVKEVQEALQQEQVLKSFRQNRHVKNPLEKRLHDVFLMDHLEGPTPDLIIFPTSDRNPSEAIDQLSPRDQSIMLGLVQWLGTNVGKDYLQKCGFQLIK